MGFFIFFSSNRIAFFHTALLVSLDSPFFLGEPVCNTHHTLPFFSLPISIRPLVFSSASHRHFFSPLSITWLSRF